MFTAETLRLAENVLKLADARKIRIGTAESCTGGLVLGALTSISGCSSCVEGGFVTYSNEAKAGMIGVSDYILRNHGAVSEQCAKAMAKGVIDHSRAQVAVSITGIAGPGGGSAKKPVGLVYIGTAVKNGPVRFKRHVFAGTRMQIRQKSVVAALQALIDALSLKKT